MKQRFKLYQGDNIQSLKKLPNNSIDSVVSDPPYGLSFMGKKWDYDVPSVEFWKEVYRVLKPGGHVLSFGGTRTYHRMVVNIEDAGFEIRNQIMWLYGSGFPKSNNIGKAVDKLQGNSEWEGWGTALKPAVEPICVARKPLSEKSVAENVLKWGTGGINIDGCRIGTEPISHGTSKMDIRGKLGDFHTKKRIVVEEKITEGRFPANIILECICGDIHTNPMCPCFIMDGQSGVSKAKKERIGIKGGSSIHQSKLSVDVEGKWPADNGGGASRFFYQAKVSKKERNMGLDGFEEKESQQKGHGLDRICMNEGCGVSMLKPELCKCDEPDWRPRPKKNSHPTIKPVQLMAYLCRLVTPPNGIILDPYMGSGSTGISACLEGFRFIGMEMDEDYFKIAEARIENYEKYREFIKK
jgi:site-specific DNA-methyltransferase (adenine-specific)